MAIKISCIQLISPFFGRLSAFSWLPIYEAGAVKIADVRNFNLICGLVESGKSGFSTTYCGYLKKRSPAVFPAGDLFFLFLLCAAIRDFYNLGVDHRL